MRLAANIRKHSNWRPFAVALERPSRLPRALPSPLYHPPKPPHFLLSIPRWLSRATVLPVMEILQYPYFPLGDAHLASHIRSNAVWRPRDADFAAPTLAPPVLLPATSIGEDDMGATVLDMNDRKPGGIEKLLQCIPVFSELSPSQLTSVAGHTLVRQCDVGQFLFRDEDRPKYLFAIIYGQVKMAISAPDGHEKVVDIAAARQVFGEASIFLDQPYQFNAEVLTRSLILCIAKAEIARLLHSNTRFAECFCGALCARVHVLVREIGTCSLKNASQRVADYLLRRCPAESPKAPVDMVLPVKKRVIASLLNLTPEALSRVFRDLREAKILETEGRHVHILDMNGLRQHGS